MSENGQPDGDFTRYDLAPGLALHARRDDRFATTTAVLYLHRPLDDTAAEGAIVPLLLKRGCRSAPGVSALHRVLEELYGADLDADVGKVGDRQLLYVRLEVPTAPALPGAGELLPRGLRLLSELVTEPVLEGDRFPAPVVERERERLRHRIAGRMDDKEAFAVERCLQETFRGEAYGRHEWGRLEDLPRLTPERVTAAWRDIVERAPADLYLVGPLDPSAARDLAAAHLRLPRAPRPALAAPVPPGPRSDPPREVLERQPIEQGKLALGLRSGVGIRDPDHVGLVAWTVALGGSSVSRLFRSVREREGLAYDASAGLDRTTGGILVTSGIEARNFRKVVDLVRREVDGLAATGPTDEELAQTRKWLLSALRASEDTPGALVAGHLERLVAGQVLPIEERRRLYEVFTAEDVRRAGSRVRLDTIYLLAPPEVAA